MGVGMLNIIVLAVLTKYYLDELRPSLAEKPRQTISSTAVFCFGSAAVVGAMMIVAVLQGGGNAVITDSLKSAIGLVPVALIYVREFRDVG